MKELLANFSVGQIILFTVLLLLAAREIGNALDYFKNKLFNWHKKKSKDTNEKDELNARLKNIEERLEYACASNEKLQKNVEALIASDKDDIKAWIVSQHKKHMALKSIDHYTLDCLHRRYQHYKEEGGNSYIDKLITDLERLPVEEDARPPQ